MEDVQCKQLFDDVEKISDYKGLKNYFLGSIVSLTGEKRDQIFIVDGQQRLTTISLLLLAMCAKSNDQEFIDGIKYKYFVNKNSEDNTQKIKLKSIKSDADNFNKLVQGMNDIDKSSHIYTNYNFF